jgi:hypothetical protein
MESPVESTVGRTSEQIGEFEDKISVESRIERSGKISPAEEMEAITGDQKRQIETTPESKSEQISLDDLSQTSPIEIQKQTEGSESTIETSHVEREISPIESQKQAEGVETTPESKSEQISLDDLSQTSPIEIQKQAEGIETTPDYGRTSAPMSQQELRQTSPIERQKQTEEIESTVGRTSEQIGEFEDKISVESPIERQKQIEEIETTPESKSEQISLDDLSQTSPIEIQKQAEGIETTPESKSAQMSEQELRQTSPIEIQKQAEGIESTIETSHVEREISPIESQKQTDGIESSIETSHVERPEQIEIQKQTDGIESTIETSLIETSIKRPEQIEGIESKIDDRQIGQFETKTSELLEKSPELISQESSIRSHEYIEELSPSKSKLSGSTSAIHEEITSSASLDQPKTESKLNTMHLFNLSNYRPTTKILYDINCFIHSYTQNTLF